MPLFVPHMHRLLLSRPPPTRHPNPNPYPTPHAFRVPAVFPCMSCVPLSGSLLQHGFGSWECCWLVLGQAAAKIVAARGLLIAAHGLACSLL